jgi:hypothetical protein
METASVISPLSNNTEYNFGDRNIAEDWLINHVLATEN